MTFGLDWSVIGHFKVMKDSTRQQHGIFRELAICYFISNNAVKEFWRKPMTRWRLQLADTC